MTGQKLTTWFQSTLFERDQNVSSSHFSDDSTSEEQGESSTRAASRVTYSKSPTQKRQRKRNGKKKESLSPQVDKILRDFEAFDRAMEVQDANVGSFLHQVRRTDQAAAGIVRNQEAAIETLNRLLRDLSYPDDVQGGSS